MAIQSTEFDGLEAIEIATSKAKMVLVSGVGPRIAHFGAAKGRNLLFWDHERKYKRKEWHLYGGHRVWATRPGADEAEETYAEDNRPCQVRKGKNSVTVTAPEIPGTRIRKSLSVRVLDESTFAVENRITNVSDMLWSGGVWGLSCTAPGKTSTYGIPLGDGTPWDVFSIVTSKRWATGQSSRVNDPQISMTEECLVLDPAGVESKRMIQAPQGIIGMTDSKEKLSFVKKVDYQRGAVYPLGTNIAFYVGTGNFMVEMETMGAESTVKPGETLVSTEIWGLRPAVNWNRYKIGSIVL